ncbi:MAG: hypothetical protein L6275_03085, partial [Candidatus Portnoybacteria bacterium]|nr:hypothetical protein [Candidatus Portnoybacteria bacterium]
IKNQNQYMLKNKNSISERSKIQIYKNDLRFLLDIKKSVGLLNNNIHDKAALIAIDILEKKYPSLKINYFNAGVRGIDLIGKEGNKIKLIAEIKTTTINKGDSLKGPQMKDIKEDLERLVNENVDYKYLILISSKVEDNLKKRLNFKKKYQNVKILTVF